MPIFYVLVHENMVYISICVTLAGMHTSQLRAVIYLMYSTE